MGKLVNHWGVTVNSEKPVTGVISNNEIAQFISDEMYNGIDLSYVEYEKEMARQYGKRSKAYRDALDEYESDSSDSWLIGDWKKDRKGLYYPDPKGEYAAIVREGVTQVVFSQYTTHAALCSPCYPGQADVRTDNNTGDFLAYTLPPAAFEL